MEPGCGSEVEHLVRIQDSLGATPSTAKQTNNKYVQKIED